jgi:hypothetical protein
MRFIKQMQGSQDQEPLCKCGLPLANCGICGALGDTASVDHSPIMKTMQAYIEAQHAKEVKDESKNKLSFNLQTRLSEVGLDKLYDIARPSEEAMMKVEKMAKTAVDAGRQWIGSTEGEDIQVSFRPSWSRTPKIEVGNPNGSFEDKMKSMLQAQKERSAADKATFMSYANFQGHVMDWGFKMIVLKNFTAVDLCSYQYVLASISEEFGGSRTAYYYDLLVRKRIAMDLENGSGTIISYMTRVDHDILKDAQARVKASYEQMGRDKSGKNGGKNQHGGGKASAKGDFGAQSWNATGVWNGGKGNDRSRSPHVSNHKGDDKNGKGKSGKTQGQKGKGKTGTVQL